MANLKQLFEESTALNQTIRRCLKLSTYDEFDDLSGLDIDFRDSEQLFLWDELRLIVEKLADVDALVTYLNSPVREVSRLHRNAGGKYEADSGRVYTCGSVIEALVSDDRHDIPFWARTRVEHDGNDYYLAGYKNVPMNGLTVRCRELRR